MQNGIEEWDKISNMALNNINVFFPYINNGYMSYNLNQHNIEKQRKNSKY